MLNHAFHTASPLPVEKDTTAILIRTEDFKTLSVSGVDETANIRMPAISVFCYRIDINRVTRGPWSAVANYEGRPRLPLDLYFLLTPWAENSEYELRILGRAMQCLEETPILTGPNLDPAGSWDPRDSIQLTIAELSTEEVMRTFDSLPSDFKLSVPYLARVVRIDERTSRPSPDVHEVRVGARPKAAPGGDPPIGSAAEHDLQEPTS